MSVKRIFLATVFAAAMPGLASANELDPNAWYLSGEVGVNWMNEEGGFIVATTTFESDFDNGWAVFIAGGRQFDNIRIELELGYRTNDISTFALSAPPGAFPADGETTQWSPMLNMLYDFDATDDIEFSLGGGLGGVLIESEWAYTTGQPIVDGEDYAFAYQLLANATYEFSHDTEVFVGYRYSHSDDVEIPFLLPVLCTCENLETDNHSLTVGIRHFFDLEKVRESAEVTPVPVPVAVAPDTYIVFFDFNKWNLTADAQSVVAEAAEAFSSKGGVRVKVVGHTDTVGSSGYNSALSERRAASVAAELVRLGVPDDSITTEGRGFSEPMVPTGPGVREPENRRAVIDLR